MFNCFALLSDPSIGYFIAAMIVAAPSSIDRRSRLAQKAWNDHPKLSFHFIPLVQI
jgi:hypothetical protein